MKRMSVVLLLSAASCGPLLSPLWAENPYLSVEQVIKVDAEYGELVAAPFNLRADWERFADAGELVLSVVAELPAQAPEETLIEIDEAYGTLYTDFGDISAGRQRIAWGVLDSLSVLDTVHGTDMRGYTAPWRESERLATDGLRWKYYGLRWYAEAVWEPVIRLSEWPEEFGPSQLYPEEIPVEGLAHNPSWDSSGISGRMCWYLSAADIGLQVGKTANRTPLPLLEGTVPADFVIREVQESYYQAGLWSVLPLKAWILRCEAAYNYEVPSLGDDDRVVVREDRLHVAGGLEWNGPGGLRLLIEGEGNLDPLSGDSEQSLEQQYLGGVSRTFLRERLEIEAGGLYSSELDGFGAELRCEYSLCDGVHLKGGLSYLESENEMFKAVAGTAVWLSLQWSM